MTAAALGPIRDSAGAVSEKLSRQSEVERRAVGFALSVPYRNQRERKRKGAASSKPGAFSFG